MIRQLILIVVALAGSIVQGSAQGVTPRPTFAQMSIPEPGWAWDTTVAAEYGSVDYVTHYFDNTGTCTDTANANGSIATPRCTPPTMTSLAAGSVVQGCGTYSRGTSDITVTASGTSADPVFFQARNATDCPGGLVFTFSGSGNMVLDNSTYLTVKGMSWTAVTGMTCTSCGHFSLLDNNISGTSTSADSGAVTAVTGATDAVRARNIIHDAGDWESATENDTHCLAIGNGTTRLWDIWNTVYHCSGDGSGNGHDADHTTTFLYISGNLFYEHRENCIDLKEVNTLVISRNECHTITTSSSSPGEGIVIHYGFSASDDGGPWDAIVLNNLIRDVVTGVAYSKVDDDGLGVNAVVGNVIYNCTVAVSNNNSSQPNGRIVVHHNTLDDCGTGWLHGAATGTFTVGGNAITDMSSRHLEVSTSGLATAGGFTVNKELLYQGGSNVAVAWASSSVTHTSVSAWVTAAGKGTGSIQADPAYVNAAARNYSLQAGSPAIDAGVDMASLAAEFNGIFGASMLIDIAGTARPDGVWDIGAYEYTDAAPSGRVPRVLRRLRVRVDSPPPVPFATLDSGGRTHAKSRFALDSGRRTARARIGRAGVGAGHPAYFGAGHRAGSGVRGTRKAAPGRRNEGPAIGADRTAAGIIAGQGAGGVRRAVQSRESAGRTRLSVRRRPFARRRGQRRQSDRLVPVVTT